MHIIIALLLTASGYAASNEAKDPEAKAKAERAAYCERRFNREKDLLELEALTPADKAMRSVKIIGNLTDCLTRPGGPQ